MYSSYGTFGLVLGIHSILRWLVVLLGVLAMGRALAARAGGRAWSPADTGLGRAFVIGLDVQALVGSVLFGVFSPSVAGAMANLTLVMQSRTFRFWLIEHPVAMLAALALAHVGFARARRVGGVEAQRRAALFYTLAVLLVLAAIPWPFLSFGRALWPLP